MHSSLLLLLTAASLTTALSSSPRWHFQLLPGHTQMVSALWHLHYNWWHCHHCPCVFPITSLVRKRVREATVEFWEPLREATVEFWEPLFRIIT
jgi:hypothetical protein